MTNREKITGMDIYDFLCKLRKGVESQSNYSFCIIDVYYDLENTILCPHFEDYELAGYSNRCDACIAKWLNSDSSLKMEDRYL